MESKITFFSSFYETMKKLPTAEERDRFAMGLLGYAFEGVEPDFEDSLALDLAFTNARPNLDASAKRAKAARENGAAGGRPETKAKTDQKTEPKTQGKTKAKTEPKTKAKTDDETHALQEKDMEKEKDMDMEKEVEGFPPLEEGNPSTTRDAGRAAAAARAAPRPANRRKYPRCRKCGELVSEISDGSGFFVCTNHGAITLGEVDYR